MFLCFLEFVHVGKIDFKYILYGLYIVFAIETIQLSQDFCHWRIQGGAHPARAPPKITRAMYF